MIQQKDQTSVQKAKKSFTITTAEKLHNSLIKVRECYLKGANITYSLHKERVNYTGTPIPIYMGFLYLQILETQQEAKTIDGDKQQRTENNF